MWACGVGASALAGPCLRASVPSGTVVSTGLGLSLGGLHLTPLVWSPQLDHVDPRAVQLGSLLVRGLTMLLLVNGACGFPWSTSDLMPWSVFDGKLFHEKYLQAEKGYAVEALVEQNVSAWLSHRLGGLARGGQCCVLRPLM